MPGSAFHSVAEIAEDQLGYFTTVQARALGVPATTLVMMERRGTTERVSRGVYRITHYPMFPHNQYMESVLWPASQIGVLSHETALSLYELSDVSPSRIHITLPSQYRLQRHVPHHLVIHRADLPADDVRKFERLPITTPERSILDCIDAHLSPVLIKQAIDEARETNLINAATAEQLRNSLRTAGRSSPTT